jgi:hypothetical protein
MKNLIVLLAIFSSINLVANPDKICVNYGDWVISDTFTQEDIPNNLELTYPLAIHADDNRAGKIYVTGAKLNYGGVTSKKANVRYSVNFGRKWNNSSLDYTTQTGSLGVRIAETPSSKVIVFQESNVFRSNNLGRDFELIADLRTLAAPLNLKTFLISDSVNVGKRMYASAVAKAPNGGFNWHIFIVYSDDNGESWSLLDEYYVNNAKETWATSIAANAKGDLYVAGHYQQLDNSYRAMLLKYEATPGGFQAPERLNLSHPGRRGTTGNRLITLENGEVLVTATHLYSNLRTDAFVIRVDFDSSAFSFDFYAPYASIMDIHKGVRDEIFFSYTNLRGYRSEVKVGYSNDNGQSWDINWDEGQLFGPGRTNYSYELAHDFKLNVYVLSQSGNNQWLVWQRPCLKWK